MMVSNGRPKLGESMLARRWPWSSADRCGGTGGRAVWRMRGVGGGWRQELEVLKRRPDGVELLVSATAPIASAASSPLPLRKTKSFLPAPLPYGAGWGGGGGRGRQPEWLRAGMAHSEVADSSRHRRLKVARPPSPAGEKRARSRLLPTPAAAAADLACRRSCRPCLPPEPPAEPASTVADWFFSVFARLGHPPCDANVDRGLYLSQNRIPIWCLVGDIF